MNERERIEEEPPPLPADALAMLGAYRDDEAMPEPARGRVWRAIAGRPAEARGRGEAAPSRWGWWIGGGLAAAAMLLLAAHLALGTGEQAARTAGPTPHAAPDRAVTSATGGKAEPQTEAPRRDATAVPTDDATSPRDATSPGAWSPGQDEPATVAPRPRAPTDRAAPRPRPREPAVEDAPAPAAPATTSDLAAERELIAAAWRALAKGSASQARAHAEAHAKRFPDGMLAPEREAVRAIATCREVGAPRPALAEAFERAHPRSPLSSKVSEACDPPAP